MFSSYVTILFVCHQSVKIVFFAILFLVTHLLSLELIIYTDFVFRTTMWNAAWTKRWFVTWGIHLKAMKMYVWMVVIGFFAHGYWQASFYTLRCVLRFTIVLLLFVRWHLPSYLRRRGSICTRRRFSPSCSCQRKWLDFYIDSSLHCSYVYSLRPGFDPAAERFVSVFLFKLSLPVVIETLY